MPDHRGEQPPPIPTIPICAIGTSAGGITALQSLFKMLPTDLGLAYVVVIHLAPDYPSVLHELLASVTQMPVHQIQDDPTLKPDCVYIIPPDCALVIDGDFLRTLPFGEANGQRLPIDRFFQSVGLASSDGIGVVLTGAGEDGAIGVLAIKESGGIVMAQDPAEAEFASMPLAAIATGAVDFVAPLASLVEHITEVAGSKLAIGTIDEESAAMDLRRIVGLLRQRTGHDFVSYKRSSVLRRVKRRIQILRLRSIAEYVGYLRKNANEAEELFSDLLISVTIFFRDRDAFDVLRRRAVRPLLDEVQAGDDVRVWVVGCATGEEAYSLAIILLEEADQLRARPNIQIFATDLDHEALMVAREGRYPRSIEGQLSETHLRRFFVDEGAHYRVSQEVRNLVLFAHHSVIREPPFVRLDLISCRNVLIYMERSLQQQVCAIFHYGLKPDRYLFLGPAETADAAQGLFTTLDRESRLYRARPASTMMLPALPNPTLANRLPMAPGRRRADASEMFGSAHVAALETSTPPSILVDANYLILHLSPQAGRFILLPGGPLTGRLLNIVRPELRLDLMAALAQAFTSKQPVLTRPSNVKLDDGWHSVLLYVATLPNSEGVIPRALISFLDRGINSSEAVENTASMTPAAELAHLHSELRAAHERADYAHSKYEATVEDLRAANEELQSLNEEYRSTAEELETSKEELQSINEELQTVNGELKGKLAVISSAHNDLQNLTASSEIGTLFLHADLRIRMFTPPISRLFNVAEGDVGRRLTNFTHRLSYEHLERDIYQVLRNQTPIEEEIRGLDGRWYTMRIKPYRTLDDKAEGAILTFDDCTKRKEAELSLQESEARLRAFVLANSDVIYRVSPDWQILLHTDGRGLIPNTEQPIAGWMETYFDANERPRVQEAITKAIRDKAVFELEHRIRRPDGSIGWTFSRAVPILDASGQIIEWFGAARDTTADHDAEATSPTATAT